jgi:hypothetical protein
MIEKVLNTYVIMHRRPFVRAFLALAVLISYVKSSVA